MRRFLIVLLAGLLTAPTFFTASILWADAPETPSLDPAKLQRLQEKVQRAPIPPGQPDLAALYMAHQRAVPGVEIDAPALYEAAQRHLRTLPSYSTRSGVEIPAGAAIPKAELGTWESLGPGNVGGRTRALVLDPRDERIMYAAGVSGGIWKTNDGGANWRPLADLMPNIAVSALAIDPRDPRILYAGTGEGLFREMIRETALPLRGAGIFKTTNGGRTWQRLQSTLGFDFRWVNDIVLSPSDSRRLYAATRTGVWQSRDGGETWNHVLETDVMGGCLDLAIRTDRGADTIFAACGTFEQATIYRNRRAREADSPWEAVHTEEGMGRTLLAIAPSNQDIIYALSTSYVAGASRNFNGGLHAVFRSDGAGGAGTWRATVRNSDPNKLNTVLLSNPLIAFLEACGFTGTSRYSNLGWHAAVLAVDPVNPEIVFAGGVDTFRSDNGGADWGPISFWLDEPASLHADSHIIVFHPDYNGTTNQTFFIGGDGGVWRTDNARARSGSGTRATCGSESSDVRWTALNNGYGVTQFYHGAVFAGGRRYLGGTQDNGTILGNDTRGSDDWFRIWGGDGGYAAIDPDNPATLYLSSQIGALVKSTDGGRTSVDAVAGISDDSQAAGEVLFIVPFVMDPNDSQTLWYGGRHAWRTTNGADTWQRASVRFDSGRTSAIAVAPGNPNRVAFGLENGVIRTTDQARTANSTTNWTTATPREGFVTWLAYDPNNPQRLYATYATFTGHHLWRSEDAGVTWAPLGATGPRRLPNLPMHTVVVDPRNSRRIFVGTDIGVMVSTDDGATWAWERTGFTNTVVESLEVVPIGARNFLFAFTHGRGAWRVEMSR